MNLVAFYNPAKAIWMFLAADSLIHRWRPGQGESELHCAQCMQLPLGEGCRQLLLSELTQQRIELTAGFEGVGGNL